MTTPSGRSASAARQAGDSFQHLVAWSRILRALPDQRGLTAVEVEALEAGNADDVVIRSDTERDEFTQARFGVDLAHPIGLEYLTDAKPRGSSLLQKFHSTWTKLGGAAAGPHLQLITNKLADPNDVVTREVDGLTSSLAGPLQNARGDSRLGKARAQLAAHLSIDEAELVAFLGDLRFRFGCQYANEHEHASSLMLAAGLKYDARSVNIGIDLIRSWVLQGRRLLTAGDVRREINRVDLRAAMPWTTLVIQAIDHEPHPDDADVMLDWVRLYEGNDPKSRRNVLEGGFATMHAELRQAAYQLQQSGDRRVMVRGAMRLATWFAAGEALSEVTGTTVLCGHPTQHWSSEDKRTPLPLSLDEIAIRQGDQLGIALAFAADPVDDIVRFITRTELPVGVLLRIAPADGARISTSQEANGYALAIKEATRAYLRRDQADHVHMFLAAPAGLALLAGHIWNRVAPTTVWEDLGLTGYTRAFDVNA